MKARQFVNAVTGYSLSHIKLRSNLFYPSTAEAQAAAMAAANDKKMKEATTTLQEEDYDELPLPRPKLSFQPPSSPSSYTELSFLPFYGSRGGGGGEEKVLCVNKSGHASIYHADACTVELVPSLRMPNRYYPVSCSVTNAGAADPAFADTLNVMDSEGSSFEALVYGDPGPPYRRLAYDDTHAWHWCTLPTPPVEDAESLCYALLHGQQDASATICVSFSRRDLGYYGGPDGTYCFDTASHEWSKAGDWTLPFRTRAHHAPELGQDLLFGIEEGEPSRFCAMDVSGIKTNSAPVMRHAWLEHADPPPEWSLANDSVAYLGAGRFCIHMSFNIMGECGYADWEIMDTVVLLTGVEVVRAPGSSGLRMVKHKSKFLDCVIRSLI
ncbi:hypothetical protein ACQ4PT_033716 [Festuca glaucescens]